MSLKYIPLIVVLLLVETIIAQKKLPKDYLTPDFHQSRREALRESMPDNSVAVFFANAVRNRANDVDYIYHQDPNFFYLTGYKEPHAVLLIFSENQHVNGQTFNEIIYVQKKNPRFEKWLGERLGVTGVKNQLGFSQVFNGEDFKDLPVDLSTFDKIMFTPFENDVRKSGKEQPNLYALIQEFNTKLQAISTTTSTGIDDKEITAKQSVDNKTLRTLMGKLRESKTKEELVLLKKAVEISCIGQIEVMKAMHPEMSEFEVQGIHEFVFKKYGAEFEGYPSIVGAGNNGCILHYIDNNTTKLDNDLVLMDLGAEYHGYTADVTRTIPANGKFSKEQKLIYDLVYEAQEAGIAAAVIGNTTRDIDRIARAVITKGLIKLGLINSDKENRLYFPHGTSHHIGLDVHDLNTRGSLLENMIITVEPGIYIPDGSNCDKKWWGIGVRIEDDVLVTKNGPINYSALAPRKSEDIEKMMQEESIFKNYSLPDLNAK